MAARVAARVAAWVAARGGSTGGGKGGGDAVAIRGGGGVGPRPWVHRRDRVAARVALKGGSEGGVGGGGEGGGDAAWEEATWTKGEAGGWRSVEAAWVEHGPTVGAVQAWGALGVVGGHRHGARGGEGLKTGAPRGWQRRDIKCGRKGM